MKSKKYNIFNQVVKIQYDDSMFSKTILEEFDIYPSEDSNKITDLIVIIDSDDSRLKTIKFSRNPKEHYYTEDIFGIDFGWGKVFWIFSEKTIYIKPNTYNYKLLRKQYALLRDPQFCLPGQWAGQRLHEDVLVGNVLFRDKMFVLHGSAMSTAEGKVIMVGGTGGTGKTSTLISLGQKDNVFFVCDDLCVLDDTGQVYVNYAYPKIYAYNVAGSKSFEKRLLSNDSHFGKFQWNFRKKRSLSCVRRRVHPSFLYHLLPFDKVKSLKLDTYVILNRSDKVSSFTIDKITPEEASDMSFYIIRNEMNKFFVPLSYRSLNALFEGKTNTMDPDIIFDTWKNTMLNVFRNIEIYKISIPYNYDNEKLKEEMSNALSKLMKL